MKKPKILSIDAWRDSDNSWYWNNYFPIAELTHFDPDISSQKIAKTLRELGILSEHSKGKIRIEKDFNYMEGYVIEIQDRSTREPLIAISTIH